MRAIFNSQIDFVRLSQATMILKNNNSYEINSQFIT